MSQVKIDTTDCVRCGKCTRTCPMGIIRQTSSNAYPEVIAERQAGCIQCIHCVAVCPVSAITVAGIAARSCQQMGYENVPRFAQLTYLLQSRRSIRSYSPNVFVTREQVEELLDIVRWSPTARNTGQIKWRIILGREKVLELSHLIIDSLSDTPWGEHLAAARTHGADPVLRGCSAVACAYTDNEENDWGTVDATIAVTLLDLAACGMRLGSCWAGILMRAAQMKSQVSEWLGIHAPQKLQAALMLGHIDHEWFRRIPYRKEQVIDWIE